MFSHNRFLFLTFSDVSLKIISVDLIGSKPKIVFFDQHSLPPEVVFDDKVVDLPRFREEVRKFLAVNEDDLKSHRVVLALNEQEVFLNRFNLNSSLPNLKSEIGKYLEPRLPYSLDEATVRFRKISSSFIQLISTKHRLICDLVSIFENTKFELVKLEPLPLPCLNLLANQQEPYLFVLAEDQTLEFGLIINKVIVFSSSLKLLKELRSSQKEIITTVKDLIDNEYENNKVTNTTLRNIFLVGQDSNILKEFFERENLKPVVIDLLENFTLENSSGIVDYAKALLTASAEKELLSFSEKDEIGINDKSPSSSFSSRIKRLSITTLLLASFFSVFIGAFLLFKSFFKERAGSNEIKMASQSASKTTTSSSEQKQPTQKPIATESQTTITTATINKADLKIEVLNGTTIKGLAKETKGFLVSKGYTVTNTGNATNSDYDQTIVKYKISKEAALEDLTSTLSERYSISRGDHLNENDQFDIIIIIGRK